MGKMQKISGKNAVTRAFDAESWMPIICAELEKGHSLHDACAMFPDGPAPETVIGWVRADNQERKGAAALYTRAREIGYLLLGDRLAQMASETHAYTLVPLLDAEGGHISDPQGNPRYQRVLVPLSSDVIAHKRLQIDTLKWKLSKMLPKVYGDKITQEHTGKDGGPIAIAAVDLKNLNDVELENMQRLMAKAAGTEK